MTKLEEMEILLSDLLDGELNMGQRSRIEALLKDTDCLNFYEDYLELHSELVFKFPEPKVHPKTKKPLLFAFAIAAAAVILIAIPLITPARPILAKITNSLDAVYSQSLMTANSTFTLDKGLIELQFANVSLILEAPLKLRFKNAREIHLLEGRLVAHSKAKSSNFTISTNEVKINKFETEFCLQATAKRTEVHASIGSVQCTRANSTSELQSNEALIYEEEVERRIAAQPEIFIRALPGKSVLKPNFIHWSFDQRNEIQIESKSRGLKPYAAKIHSQPSFEKGIFGEGIRFDGKDDFLSTNFPGFGGNNPRTVAFWVRIPPDAAPQNAISMLAWGSYAGSGKTFQISWNWRKEEGLMGGLRAGLLDGQIVGSSDLRDGIWHHVAIVTYGGRQADVSTHIMLYIDGSLHPSSAKSFISIDTDIDSDQAIKLLMGRAADNYFKNNKPKTFRGELDEVYLFDAALTGDQIRSLQKNNQLPEK